MQSILTKGNAMLLRVTTRLRYTKFETDPKNPGLEVLLILSLTFYYPPYLFIQLKKN